MINTEIDVKARCTSNWIIFFSKTTEKSLFLKIKHIRNFFRYEKRVHIDMAYGCRQPVSVFVVNTFSYRKLALMRRRPVGDMRLACHIVGFNSVLLNHIS